MFCYHNTISLEINPLSTLLKLKEKWLIKGYLVKLSHVHVRKQIFVSVKTLNWTFKTTSTKKKLD